MPEVLYQEEIRSARTSALFAVLSVLFLTLFFWRFSAAGWAPLPRIFLLIGLFFLFYLINYRTLRITITDQQLLLNFGLVPWKTDLANIKSVGLDDSPWYIKYGGAGVHFAHVSGTYRTSFNFLDHPRVTLVLREKQGPVQGLCFTTRQPDLVQKIIKEQSSRP